MIKLIFPVVLITLLACSRGTIPVEPAAPIKIIDINQVLTCENPEIRVIIKNLDPGRYQFSATITYSKNQINENFTVLESKALGIPKDLVFLDEHKTIKTDDRILFTTIINHEVVLGRFIVRHLGPHKTPESLHFSHLTIKPL